MNLVGHKIMIYTTMEQEAYLDRAFGTCRYAYNKLLAHFSQEGVDWSIKDAWLKFKEIREEWFKEFSSDGIASSSLHNLRLAYKNFFKNHKKKRCYPRFKTDRRGG